MDKIVTVEKGAPHSVALMQSGTLLPGCKVICVALETGEQCGPNQLGEVTGRKRGSRSSGGGVVVVGEG